jgi:uncharacterized Ntn-hydrolase superfamily protein
MKHFCITVFLIALVVLPTKVHATYSVVAVDTATRQVGGAAASCISPTGCLYCVFGANSRGAVVVQAQGSVALRKAALSLLAQGVSPRNMIVQMVTPTYDADFQSRQYGIVSLDSSPAGFTGAFVPNWSLDYQRTIGSYSYATQGNELTSPRVITQLKTAFETTGCDLADKLMVALEAGARNGEGDKRCTPNGIPANSAFIKVDQDGVNYLKIVAEHVEPQNPITLLRNQYNQWRQSHPCPVAASAVSPADAPAIHDQVDVPCQDCALPIETYLTRVRRWMTKRQALVEASVRGCRQYIRSRGNPISRLPDQECVTASFHRLFRCLHIETRCAGSALVYSTFLRL